MKDGIFKSMKYVAKAGQTKCDQLENCLLCDYQTYCKYLRLAYREAENILSKEVKS